MSDRYAAFRHSAFSRYFTARFLTAFATQILSVAVGYEIYDITGNPIWLGWIGLVQFFPALILVVVTGFASDKFGRRLVMGLAILLEMLCVFGVILLAFSGNFRPIPVLIVLTLFGVARAFMSPASASLVVNVVPKRDFANAVGWVTSSWQIASVVGPAVGGVLHLFSASLAFAVSGVAFAIAAFLIFSIPKPKQKLSKEPTNLKTLAGGFRYIWHEKIVLGAISLDLFAMLLAGAVALMPVYAKDILEVGRLGNGLLRAAPGIGAIIMAVWLVSFPIKDHAGKILFGTVALFGLATVVFGASKLAWLSIVALMLVGAFDMVSVYIREVLLQLWTPDHVRGRVNAVNSIFLGASNELGEFRAGFMAAAYGTVFTVVAGGFAAVGVAALWIQLFPQLYQTNSLDGPENLDQE